MSDKFKSIEGKDNNVPDVVQQVLEDALIEVKRQRTGKIGALLDKAADVLDKALEDNREPAAKMRTIETAIALYNSQEEHVRQDKKLELQKQQLELERQKLLAPGGPLFQQNNLYVNARQPQGYRGESSEEEKEMLLQRKRAQDAILRSYLKPEKGTADVEVPNEDSEVIIDQPEEEETK